MGGLVRLIGNIAIIAGIGIFALVYGPLMFQEMVYRVRPTNYYQLSDGPRNEILNTNPDKIISPEDTDFGIVIPKINANASIITNVDPNNPKDYQTALTKGVAHAAGSSTPNSSGNVFLFSHSAGNFWEAARYNAEFYLLNKLEADDEVFLYYRGQKYAYRVTDKKVVNPAEVIYASSSYGNNTLVLMTCWPAGTTFKRVVVIAQKVID